MESTKRDFINPFLTRFAERRSNDIGLEVKAPQIDDAVPFHFVAQELLIGAEVAALFASLRARVATVLQPAPAHWRPGMEHRPRTATTPPIAHTPSWTTSAPRKSQSAYQPNFSTASLDISDA